MKALPDLDSSGRITMRRTTTPISPETIHRARLSIAAHAKGKADYLALAHMLGVSPWRGEGMEETQAGASTL